MKQPTTVPLFPALRTAALGLLLAPLPAFADVFINELHYDNTGSDVGEAVEIAATGGETLSGYTLYLYNGASVYATATVPAGSTSTCGGSVRLAVVEFAANGLQNGPADGLALVDASGNVVQFISYEGGIHASSGPADGLDSDELPVSESSSATAGTSLQLQGDGVSAGDFTWAAGVGETFGSCNAGQGFGGGGSGGDAPQIVSTTPADGASGFPAAGDLGVGFSEAVTAGSGAFTLSCATSGSVALTYPSTATDFSLSTGTALHGGESCSLGIVAAEVEDSEGLHPAGDLTVTFTVASSSGGTSGYYSKVNTSSPAQLRCSLHETIKGHTAYPYSGSGTNTWTILEIADEDPSNSGKILDLYRNRSYTKVSDRAGTGSGTTYNREHTWPNSLGFGSATGDLGLPYAPYTDTHMLYLSDTSYNSSRGNKPLADCTSTASCSQLATEANAGYGGSGTSADANWVAGPDGNSGSFEVWDHRKGDIARAVMYMAIRYEGGTDAGTGQSEPDLELTDNRSLIVATSSSPAYMGLLSTLLAWNAADPPDAAEQDRNEVIYGFQGNRNPFIDHPEWATEALFTSSTPAVCTLAE